MVREDAHAGFEGREKAYTGIENKKDGQLRYFVDREKSKYEDHI